MVSKHAHCLKPLAALVFDCSDGRTTAGEIARTAEQRLGFGVTEADVADAVSQLGSLGLLQTPLVVLPGVEGNGNGVSRREMLRRVGFAGAAAATATTLVTSIVAPTPAMAASGIPSGCSGCVDNHACISNHCCQSNPGKQCDQSCCVGLNNSCHVTGCRCAPAVATMGSIARRSPVPAGRVFAPARSVPRRSSGTVQQPARAGRRCAATHSASGRRRLGDGRCGTRGETRARRRLHRCRCRKAARPSGLATRAPRLWGRRAAGEVWRDGAADPGARDRRRPPDPACGKVGRSRSASASGRLQRGDRERARARPNARLQLLWSVSLGAGGSWPACSQCCARSTGGPRSGRRSRIRLWTRWSLGAGDRLAWRYSAA